MKNLFTFGMMIFVCHLGGYAQKSILFNVNKAEIRHQAKIKELEGLKQGVVNGLKVSPSYLLKSSQLLLNPTWHEEYQFSSGNWELSSQSIYDNQGRVVEYISNNYRKLTEYVDTEQTVITYQQTRADALSAWESNVKEVRIEQEDLDLHEIFMADGMGGWTLTSGFKEVESTDVVGLVTTHTYQSWQFNDVDKVYEVTWGYKNVNEELANGNFRKSLSYEWGNGDWQPEGGQEYVYDVDGRLTNVVWFYVEDGEYQKVDLIYTSGDVPTMAFFHEKANANDEYVFKGRYIDLLWVDWNGGLLDGQLEPLSAVMQLVIDPAGDLNDANNYVNYEKSVSGDDYSADYVWIDGDWFLQWEYKEETLSGGIVVVTDTYFDIDDNTQEVFGGEKEVRTSSPEGFVDIRYNYDVESKDWIQTEKVEQSILAGEDNFEMKSYSWEDLDEDGVFEWVLTSVFRRVFSALLEEDFHETYMDGELFYTSSSKKQYNSYGHEVSIINEWGGLSSFYNSETGMMDWQFVMNYNEDYFDHVYDDNKLIETIRKWRNTKDGEYELRHKTVYYFTPVGVNKPLLSVTLNVYPTATNSDVTVRVSNSGTLTVVDLKGRCVLTKYVVPGENTISLVDVANGLYVIRMVSAEGASNTAKVVKK
jgi:hypothetical protein